MQFHELACSSFLCLSSSQEFRSACFCLPDDTAHHQDIKVKFTKPFNWEMSLLCILELWQYGQNVSLLCSDSLKKSDSRNRTLRWKTNLSSNIKKYICKAAKKYKRYNSEILWKSRNYIFELFITLFLDRFIPLLKC